MDHATALACVDRRIDVYGNPLFRIANQRDDLMGSVRDNIDEPLEPESGFVQWQKGDL